MAFSNLLTGLILAELHSLAEQWIAEQRRITQTDIPFRLFQQAGRLELHKTDEPKLGPIFVDFTSGTMAHRRQFGGGRGEAVAKAVGIKGDYLPTIVDATAGLGRDAFVLAALGCHVTMFERHPVVAALLADGLMRGYQDATIGHWLSERLHLVVRSTAESQTCDDPSISRGPLACNTSLLSYQPKPDVVYLDPMFPHRQKSALVKKEMRVFQTLVGSDHDADALLIPARQLAKKRVVVKRPSYAPFLANELPIAEISTKNHRFDLYSPL